VPTIPLTAVRRRAFYALAAAVSVLTSPHVSADGDLPATLARTSAYVDRVIDRVVDVVSDQREVQHRDAATSRELTAHFFVLRVKGTGEYVQCRELMSADRRSVVDRHAGELDDLVGALGRAGSTPELAARCRATDAKAREYDLDDIGSINQPLMAVLFLHAQYRDRFTFTLGAIDRKMGGARVLAFAERPPAHYGPTLAHGRVWIDDQTGAIRQTELLFGDAGTFLNRIVTTFTLDPALGVNVPVRLEESFGSKQSGATSMGAPPGITGVVTYGAFRRLG
jgi:hypothetical protein